jgi:hypothetical protein
MVYLRAVHAELVLFAQTISEFMTWDSMCMNGAWIGTMLSTINTRLPKILPGRKMVRGALRAEVRGDTKSKLHDALREARSHPNIAMLTMAFGLSGK